MQGKLVTCALGNHDSEFMLVGRAWCLYSVVGGCVTVRVISIRGGIEMRRC